MEFKLDWSPSPAHKLSGFGAFACRASPDEKPPSKTDLSEQWPVDRSQGKAGTCVAFATTAAMEYVVRTNSIHPTPLSQRFVYYTARVLMENQNAADDTGTHTVTAIQALKKYGAAPEVRCKFIASVCTVSICVQHGIDASCGVSHGSSELCNVKGDS